MPAADDQDHPQNTEAADANAGNGGGQRRAADTAHGSGEYFHKHEEGIEGDDPEHRIGTDTNDVGIGCKNAKDEYAENKGEAADQQLGCKAHTKAGPYTFADAVVFLRTEILTDEGGNGNTKGTGDHPCQAVSLGKSGPRSGGYFAKGIDAGLHQQIGKIEGNKLQSGRKTNEQDPLQQHGVDLDMRKIQTDVFRQAAKRTYHQHSADDLRKYGCEGSTGNSQL